MKDDVHNQNHCIYKMPRGPLHISIAKRVIHIHFPKRVIIFKMSRGTLHNLISKRAIIFKQPRTPFIFKLPKGSFIFKFPRGSLHIQTAERVIAYKFKQGFLYSTLPRRPSYSDNLEGHHIQTAKRFIAYSN